MLFTQIEFTWPWLFLLLPLPIILRLILPASDRNQDAPLHVPFIEDFERQQHSTNVDWRHPGLNGWENEWIFLSVVAT